MEQNHGRASLASPWILGPETLFKDGCIKESCRSFLAVSKLDGLATVICYKEDANLHRDYPIHASEEHGSWASTPTLQINMNNGSGRTPLRYWSVVDTEGNAAHGVLVRSTLARPLDPNSFKSRQMAEAFDYDKCFGTANIVMDALSWLGTDKKKSENFRNDYMIARSFLTTTEFVLFPFLPKELRLMIWKYASHHSRFIEIIHQPTRDVPESDELHLFYTVAPLSHQCPPVLHASHESREEGPKYYNNINLEFRHLGDIEKEVKFNPSVDILLFNTSCCIQTLAQFCRIAFFRGQKFSRVAVSCSSKFRKNCEIVVNIPPHAFDPDYLNALAIDVLRGINTSGNNQLQPLHLPNGANDPSSMLFYPRLPSVKEILHVVETHLDEVKRNQVDYATTFRFIDPSAGIDRIEIAEKELTEYWVKKYSTTHPIWQLPAANPWVGVSLPSFLFISLGSIKPWQNGNTARWSTIWNRKDLEQSGLLYQDVESIIGAITGCQITFPLNLIQKDPPGLFQGGVVINDDRVEIGISGPNEAAVQEALAAMDALLAQNGSWYPHFQRYLRYASEHFPFYDAISMVMDTTLDEKARNMATTPQQYPDEFPIQVPTSIIDLKPMYNLMDMLNMIDATTIPARRTPRSELTFPATHDPIEKHRWLLSDQYYRGL